MIGIDWGTSSFRAWRLGPGGAILGRVESDDGILGIPPGGFPAALRAAIGPWLAEGETLVLLCGMVGSRQGWQEAPYLACPAGPAEIAATLTPLEFEDARCLLVPGLSTRDAAGVPDVMRGEETKLIGMLAETGDAPVVACLPGTHAKWARIGDGQVQGFTTHMTGEVRAVLLEHSILGRLAQPGPLDEAAFLRGVRRARDGAGLLHHLSGTRALGLMGELAPAATDSYLSGLLIGHEVNAALAGGAATGPIHLAGAATLTRAYVLAFGDFGLEHRLHDPDLALRGLALIAETLA
jgi:2-dehydro-3-deoxygalactonokinase